MNDRELRTSLRRLADQVTAVRTPDEVEAAVLEEFDREWGQRRQRTRLAALVGALAASVVAGVLLSRPQPKAAAPAPEIQAFLPIPYTPPLQPYERIMVVQTSVPVKALIAAGFHVQASEPGGSVPADVMVSQDGRPRAIRPVSWPDRRVMK